MYTHMKSRLLVFSLVLSGLFIVACGDDDAPPVNPLVGEWELDEIIVVNPPSGYSSVDGVEFNTLAGESSYVITFNSDLTYSREVDDIPQQGDLEDEGTWSLDEDDLSLDVDDGDEANILFLDFDVNGDIDDKLNVTVDAEIFALSDAILSDPQFVDTVKTQAQFNAVFQQRAVSIPVELELEFDKQ